MVGRLAELGGGGGGGQMKAKLFHKCIATFVRQSVPHQGQASNTFQYKVVVTLFVAEYVL